MQATVGAPGLKPGPKATKRYGPFIVLAGTHIETMYDDYGNPITNERGERQERKIRVGDPPFYSPVDLVKRFNTATSRKFAKVSPNFSYNTAAREEDEGEAWATPPAKDEKPKQEATGKSGK